jgi:AcrR family transcriptional regulator
MKKTQRQLPSAARKATRREALRPKKGDVTRERIRDAVVRLVSRHGVSGVVLHDICREAGITHGGFYFHFENKEEAMIDVAQEWMMNFKGRVLATPYFDDFYDEIYQMIVVYIRGYIEKIQVTRLVYELDPKYVEVRRTFTVNQRRWWARLDELFTRTRQKAGLPTGMETWVTQALTASLEGICVNTYLVGLPELTQDTVDPEAVAERQAIIWHRSVLGRDPDSAKLKFVQAKAVALKT